jgi:hypothetical protein
VLVDDTLALLANLGVLVPPGGTVYPLLTVYAFQLRIAGALTVERATKGHLQRLVESHAPAPSRPLDLLMARTEFVHVVDPTELAAETAAGKVRWGSFVPAEVVAVAAREKVAVRLSAGNARGRLREALVEHGVPFGIWRLEARGDKLVAIDDLG